jgi:hypothetical protein
MLLVPRIFAQSTQYLPVVGMEKSPDLEGSLLTDLGA